MKNSKKRAFEIRRVTQEEERDGTYAPEKFTDNYGHRPVRYWQDFSLARLDNPSNFEAD